MRRSMLLIFVLTAGLLQAQNNLITYSEPQEVAGVTISPTATKVVIISPNKDLSLTHSMGHERGELVGREPNGEYRYELTHNLNEDEQDDGFCKTTVTVSVAQGSKSSALVLRAGKCYMGTFEIPFKFSCVDESNDKAVYPYEGKAKVSFTSEEADLQIKFNGTTVVEDGKPLQSLGYVEVQVSKESGNSGLTVYELTFDTNSEAAGTSQFKRPTFGLRSSFSNTLEVQLREGAQLNAKTMFKYRVLLQLVETVIKTKKVLTSATMQLMANAEQASKDRKFVAAQGFYQQALDSLGTDGDVATTRIALEENITHMTECTEWDQKAAKYMQYIKQLKESESTDKMSTIEEAFQQALVCYTNLDRLHPDPVYKTFISRINKSLEAFNFIVIEGTVRDRRDNTKVVAGDVEIYGVHSRTFDRSMEKKAQGTLLGAIDATGKFRVQVDKGTYLGLLFVPTSANKVYDKNGFVSLEEQKHLKTTVYISE